MTNRTIVKSVKDALAVSSNIIESAESEIVWLVPPSMLVYASSFGLNEKTELLMRRGGHSRGISDISLMYIDAVHESLNIGEEVRHYAQRQGVYFIVADKKESVSSMSVDAESLSLDDPLVALWTDDATYAKYLMSTFELVWEQAIPAAHRIEELLKERTPSI